MVNIKVTLTREVLPQDIPPGLVAGFAMGEAVEELLLNVDLREEVALYAVNVQIDGHVYPLIHVEGTLWQWSVTPLSDPTPALPEPNFYPSDGPRYSRYADPQFPPGTHATVPPAPSKTTAAPQPFLHGADTQTNESGGPK